MDIEDGGPGPVDQKANSCIRNSLTFRAGGEKKE